MALAWARTRERHRPGRALLGDGALREAALARFGYALTRSQAEALAEIDEDLGAPRRMLRLLQGDVGSGKTVVAALAMLRAAEAGAQAALMAPTEVLAQQHHRTLTRLCPVPVGLLTGSVKGVARRNLLSQLANGGVKLVVGTHALFQESVHFRDLALAVIDEQHRFGVDQRLSLGEKGERTDVLVMTATPIPRTLLLTQWGEMEVSRLAEKPAGRQPIRTTVHSLALEEDVLAGISRALGRGDRIYWVCPLSACPLVTEAYAKPRLSQAKNTVARREARVGPRQEGIMLWKTRTPGFIKLLVATALAGAWAPVAARATVVDLSWSGENGYTAAGQFSYDGATAPSVITEKGAGATSTVQSFSISFYDPTHTLLESGSSVIAGVSSDRYFTLTYDTAANTISSLDADIGGSYFYFLSDLRTPTGDVVGPGETGFNFFDRRNADVALDTASSITTTVVPTGSPVPEPAPLGAALPAALALLIARRRGARA